MKRKLGDLRGALADLDSADELEPNNDFTLRYIHLGLLVNVERPQDRLFNVLCSFGVLNIQVSEFLNVNGQLQVLQDVVHLFLTNSDF